MVEDTAVDLRLDISVPLPMTSLLWELRFSTSNLSLILAEGVLFPPLLYYSELGFLPPTVSASSPVVGGLGRCGIVCLVCSRRARALFIIRVID